MQSLMETDWHGTTIISVQMGKHVIVAGDGQVTLGNITLKSNARKYGAWAT